MQPVQLYGPMLLCTLRVQVPLKPFTVMVSVYTSRGLARACSHRHLCVRMRMATAERSKSVTAGPAPPLLVVLLSAYVSICEA